MHSATYDLDEPFEQLYIRLRTKEGRIYTDEEIAGLPEIDRSHPYFHEWQIRKQSMNKLLAYIMERESASHILEVGCGNGWLSAQLALSTKADITGIDINYVELEQAARTFQHLVNLRFINDDIRENAGIDKKADYVIFAASIQYFPSLKEILTAAMEYLSENGEIHIIDSHFYPKSKIDAARNRTRDYYRAMDADIMTEYYFHHAVEELACFKHTVLYNPNSWKNRFSYFKHPFHWIRIKNNN